MTDLWGDLVWSALADFKARLVAALPSVLALLTLVLGGLILAWLAGKLLARLAHATDLDRRTERWGLAGALRRAGVMRPPSAALERTVFWGIFALFAVLGVDALRIPGTWRITDFLFLWIPSLVGAALLLLVGWLAANFLAQSVLIAAVNAGCARGPAPRPRRARGRPSRGVGDGADPSRHRQGDGAARLRPHLRRARPRPRRWPSGSAAAASRATSSSGASVRSATSPTRERRSPTSKVSGGDRACDTETCCGARPARASAIVAGV